MVYVSPVHVRERSGELAHSTFLADHQQRGGGTTGAVMMDAAAQSGLWLHALTALDICVSDAIKKSM
jgi:hypothetical protein